MTLALIVWLVMAAIPAMKVIGFFLLLATIFCVAIGCGRAFADKEPGMLNWTRKQLKWSVPVLLLAAFLPSEKTSWYMVGAYGTQKLVESPVAQELASDGVDVMKSLLARAKAEIEDKPEVKK